MLISLDQIEILAAIEKAGSISAAAEELKRAKSAVYYSIRKLEEQIGFAVLETTAYRGTLTTKGRQLLVRSHPMLEAMAELKQDVHQIATGVEMRLAISTTALFDLRIFNRQIREILKAYPDTEIVSHREILSGEMMLQQKLVDLAIFEKVTDISRFECKEIDRITMKLVIAANHPFLQLPEDKQVEAALFRYPQIVQRSTLPDEDSHGVYARSRRWTVSDLASKRQIIIDGLGWGRLPHHDIEADLRNGTLRVLDHIEEPSELPIYIGREKGREHGVVCEALWDIFDSCRSRPV